MFRAKILTENALLSKIGEDGLDEIEEAYGVDLSDGAEIVELPDDKKVTARDIENILDMNSKDPSIPLIIVSPKGFTDDASDLAFEYEDVVLCTSRGKRWFPLEVNF